MPDTTSNQTSQPKRRRRPARAPKVRNCKIYERHILEGQTQEQVAAAFGITQQRVGQIAARVEAWIATHADHPLAQCMRLRSSRRWEAIWSRAIEGFDRSQQDRQITKERVLNPPPDSVGAAGRHAADGDNQAPLVTVSERTVRQQNGDPRFLTVAARVAERDDRIWRQEEAQGRSSELPDTSGCGQNAHELCCAPGGQSSHEFGAPANGDALGITARRDYKTRFPSLPAGLCDLEYLACGLRSPNDAVAEPGETAKPVSTLFEQRCAEAFRCLGFDVRELGQGCGRVADCLAVAAVERFAVIIDAKVRRRGYTLGTDDRQFCEYATRHTRELALSGVEKVYFAVIGRGFRREDLDKLAGFMTGTPIRSVSFIEAAALMRLVNDSIARRREFRLDQLDRLLFGNKIIDEEMLTPPIRAP